MSTATVPVPPVALGAAGPAAAPQTRRATQEAATYVPEVDALRSYAMSAVVVFHCGLAPFGWMGVWLFFVISGFAVTTSLLARRQRAPAASTGHLIRNFYQRRALRIWPIYFAFVGVNVAVLLALGRTGPLEDVPWLATFTFNLKMIFTEYTPSNTWPAFGHLWTLSVEQQFYLVFPILFLLRGRRAFAIALVAIIAAAPVLRWAVGAWASSIMGWDAGRSAFAVFAPAHFDAFAVGALIALFRAEIAARPDWTRAAWVAAVAVAAAHVAVYLSIGLARAGGPSVEAFRNIVSGIAYGEGREVFVYVLPVLAGAALLMGILSRQSFCVWLCRLQGMQAIGRVSYGAYLFHLPVLMALHATIPAFTAAPGGSVILPRLALFACAYPLTVGLAWLSFTYFEQRFLRARRKYG